MVYSKTEEELSSKYFSLISLNIAHKYPQFLNNINAQWEKRSFWAHCYWRSTIIRGNHTNNYAEAGIRILKDLVFARVKAYNLVQMFYFVVEHSFTSTKAHLSIDKDLTQSRNYLPIRNEPMGRRIHSLRENIQVGQQNAGK